LKDLNCILLTCAFIDKFFFYLLNLCPKSYRHFDGINGGITGAHFVQNVTVSSLMNLNDESWNEEVVRHVFSVDIAYKILHTSFIAQVQDDRLIWKAERHGRYFVCSAYMCWRTRWLLVSSLPGLLVWHLEAPGSP